VARKPVIVAAGGVVWRPQPAGPEVAVIRRERYRDWTLPKGKLEPNESELLAAVREVREEIGAEVAVSRTLDHVRYRVDGAIKTVAFWVMRYLRGEFAPSAEIDELKWLTPEVAASRLSYPVDRSVLDSFTSRPLPEAVVVLVRHARAGKRSQWHADDRLRPLDPDGGRQAQRLAVLLTTFAPSRILSADLVRCIQTVQPLAEALGLQVELSAEFADESYESDPSTTITALRSLAKPDTVTVVCSQGVTIPGIIDQLGELGPVVPPSSQTRKAAAWVLAFADGDVISADYYEDAIR
jgi:8-oxo-(d)GTP phosphatase